MDEAYWARLGVQEETCDVSQPDTGEEALEIMETLLRTGGYSVIALDSIASLLPTKEQEGDMGDSHVGLQARLMSQAMRNISPLMHSPNVNTLLLFTNQTRSKIGPFGGTTTPGGNAMKFYASFRVKMWMESPKRILNGDDHVGQITTCQMIKNKVASPYRTAKVPIIFGKGVDEIMSLFDMAVEYDVISQSGSWYSLGKLRLGQGRENSIETLRNDAALAYGIYDQLLTAIMARRGYTPDLKPIPGFESQSSHRPLRPFQPTDTDDLLSEAGFIPPETQVA